MPLPVETMIDFAHAHVRERLRGTDSTRIHAKAHTMMTETQQHTTKNNTTTINEQQQ